MAGRLKPFKQLRHEQAAASDPDALVWLSASAGTGKTHVLTARVLRLLLNGVDPSAILCLTFTKAGAAEMAERLHARLAGWVQARPQDLAKDLFALGEAHDEDAIGKARILFARVLDAPAGGLRIQTIHAFCQTLLAAFPAEAGLAPGFRPLDARAEAALARSTLAEMLVGAEAGGDLGLVRDVQALSLRLGEGGAEAYLLACARSPQAFEALGPGIEARLRRALDIPAGDIEAAIAEACADDRFDCGALKRMAAANVAWGAKRGLEHADLAAKFLGAEPHDRARLLDEVVLIALTKSGDPRSHSPKLIGHEPDYAELCVGFAGACRKLLELREKARFAALLTSALSAGQAYARAYTAAKRAAGVVDFDDLIRKTDDLLNTPGVGQWVRYKLDRAIDHILVDEAQDTNARQWAIVAGLAAEFFAGEGARVGVHRTIFTVGDFKQAIFGFQGTDPRAFAAARIGFTARAKEAEREIADLSLAQSFRSTPPVLKVVDQLLDDLGPEEIGLSRADPPHRSARAGLPGTVTLWRPFSLADRGDPADEGEEGWVDDATRGFAGALARQIREWLDAPLMLEALGRPLRPEDVLVLVRRRGTLASLLVARLHAEGVPVAGVDRLRLNAPLGVRDLLAAIRFAVQPDDDLTLASLLVSPLIGLDQGDLFTLAHGRNGSLWRALRDDDRFAAARERCARLLAAADLVTPYRFLEEILSGPLDGRARLLRRLGPEARDPIEELLSAALGFERESTASLQLFLDWFDRGEVEITRDPSAPLDAVRVMTVHGSKGLQAPLVILADATGDPDAARSAVLTFELEDRIAAPIPRPRKAETIAALEEAVASKQRAERAEHWRLLYVAATRAEERLVIGGALPPRCKGIPPAASWYAALDRAISALGAEWSDDPIWGAARVFAEAGTGRLARPPAARPRPPALAEPGWLRTPAPQEARPPRPLAPSAVGQDDVADPPPGPGQKVAAQRGKLLHALFERLPGCPAADRARVADRWLRENAGVADLGERRRLTQDVCAILADPEFAEIFSGEALTEAPIAAVVDGEVIAGTVDRLLVGPDRVRIVDYKTGAHVPRAAQDVPRHHREQMAAYAAALAVIFPDRPVEAALLYTSGPRLITLPPEALARDNPGLPGREQSFAATG